MKKETNKVCVRLLIPSAMRTMDGQTIFRPKFIERVAKEDEDGYPYIKYAREKIYIRRARFFANKTYEKCNRSEAGL